MLILAAGVVAIVGAGALAAVFWWRSYFRRLFGDRFKPQDDGSYIVLWTRGRGQPVEAYRIDAVTRDRALTCLVAGSVVGTGIFVVLIIARVLMNVPRPAPLAILALLALGIVVTFLPQRRANRKAGRLIVTGTRVDHAEELRPSPPNPEATARSLRLIVLVSCAIAVIGIAVCAIFALDPDRGATAWTDRCSFALMLLLVVLPICVALFSWWALRRIRSSKR